MEHKSPYTNGYHLAKNNYPYSELFNLDSVRNFQVPHDDDDDPDNYTSSSQDESNGIKGYDTVLAQINGGRAERPSDLPSEMALKRKRYHVEPEAGYNSSARKDADSNDEDDDDFEKHISEEYYRTMLGEHAQKFKKANKLKAAAAAAARIGPSTAKRTSNGKSRKLSHGSQMVLKDERTPHGLDVPALAGPHIDDAVQNLGNYNHLDIAPEHGPHTTTSGLLEIAEGVTFEIPPVYDKLAPLLNLPNFTDVRIEESFLKGRLDLRSLSAMMAADKRIRRQNCAGMGEPSTKYETLQGRLKALSSSCDSSQKFCLQVFDSDLEALPTQQESLGIQRLIMSETGKLQICYVKVLEKGDSYEIIERKLPKKHPIQKDPSVVEREDAEKIAKNWANIVKRDLPKHHKTFSLYHRKQSNDAKKFAEYCQKEVKARSARSLKLMKAASMRTRKLARDMLLYYKKADKEQAEIRKKEERDAAEALKRAEELREAKRQQQRLNFLLSQTELYSHFMQNKSASQAAEPSMLAAGASTSEADVGQNVDDVKPTEEEDPEETAFKEEAIRVAKNAVSEQKKKNECI